MITFYETWLAATHQRLIEKGERQEGLWGRSILIINLSFLLARSPFYLGASPTRLSRPSLDRSLGSRFFSSFSFSSDVSGILEHFHAAVVFFHLSRRVCCFFSWIYWAQMGSSGN